MNNIFGRWSGYEDMRNDWFDRSYEKSEYKPYEYPPEFPTEDEVLFASYGGGSYEGDATLIWKRDGKFYECEGAHCSCYGLEGQFDAEETTLDALAAKGKKEGNSSWYFLSEHDGEAYVAYWNLIEELKGERGWSK